MNEFEKFLLLGIQENKISLAEIAKCETLASAKPLLDALHERDGFDALEGYLRMGLNKSMSWGEQGYKHLLELDKR